VDEFRIPQSAFPNLQSAIYIMGSMPSSPWLLIGAILAGLAVAAGAFGAHGLKAHFSADGSLSPSDEQQLANWETAARYQMYHGLALLAVGLLAAHRQSRVLDAAGFAFTAGVLIFSGCLYALVLTGHRWLGAIVPIGGALFLLGWLLLAWTVCLRGACGSRSEPQL
jgi:uncharacterized membrane protein YgdD (TMEM256/DUF423 family)